MAEEWGLPQAPQFEFTADEKRKFAAAILKNPVPLEAAISVFGPAPGVLGKALYAASNWPLDNEVIAFKLEILQGEQETDLPDKVEAARRVWEWTKDGQAPSKEKIAAMQLYCELRNFISKDSGSLNVIMPPKIVFQRDSANDDSNSRRDTAAV